MQATATATTERARQKFNYESILSNEKKLIAVVNYWTRERNVLTITDTPRPRDSMDCLRAYACVYDMDCGLVVGGRRRRHRRIGAVCRVDFGVSTCRVPYAPFMSYSVRHSAGTITNRGLVWRQEYCQSAMESPSFIAACRTAPLWNKRRNERRCGVYGEMSAWRRVDRATLWGRWLLMTSGLWRRPR